jgi:rubrerythrin
MFGVIRRRNLIAHPFVTVDSFGWRFFLRALVTGRDKTFLSLLAGTGVLRPPKIEISELLGRCVDLESRARRIYEWLAERFGDRGAVREFFRALAAQEQEHYELLELCRQLAGRHGWLEEVFAPWRPGLVHVERQMDDLEASLEGLGSLADALRLVIRLEGSEIDQVYHGAVTATDSEFVRVVSVFRHAQAQHIAYICDRIPKLEPGLAAECEKLRAAHSSEPGE